MINCERKYTITSVGLTSACDHKYTFNCDTTEEYEQVESFLLTRYPMGNELGYVCTSHPQQKRCVLQKIESNWKPFTYLQAKDFIQNAYGAGGVSAPAGFTIQYDDILSKITLKKTDTNWQIP